jgi:hypothetical protein
MSEMARSNSPLIAAIMDSAGKIRHLCATGKPSKMRCGRPQNGTTADSGNLVFSGGPVAIDFSR